MIVVFDFEVFRYDTLLGTLILHDDGTEEVCQMWDLNEIKEFYKKHKLDLWVGHNNDYYDNFILKAILEDKDIYKVSKSLINRDDFRAKCNLDIVTYDLMCCRFYSLKMTELANGKSLDTTEVSFDLGRPLTEAEKKLTESYNRSDLSQTRMNLNELMPQLTLRLDLLKEFKIDKKYLTATEAKLASLALHAKQIPGIETKYVKPRIYETMKVRNKDAIDFYLNEDFRKGKKLTIKLCGVDHQMGSGGIHAARKQCHETDMLYLDVSGYYNLVMINYDLLPRTIPDEGKELYEYMYHEQLRLKGVDDAKRSVYKTVLLSVFGASMNKYTDFYDPEVGSLITIVGQMFLVDLLEKLEGKVRLIQSNTDGIIVKPLNDRQEVLDIVKEWCDRTGFVIKPKTIKELYQRDVNCYCYNEEHGWNAKGDAFIADWAIDQPIRYELWSAKEPSVVATAVKDYFLSGVKPKDTIEKYRHDIRRFQFLCKKLSYKYCTLESIDESGKIEVELISDLNRAFAKKYDGKISTIYKYKDRNGKEVKCKMPNMPESVFIYNDSILDKDVCRKLEEKIDYDWYLNRAYKRIKEFIKTIDDINI